MIATSVRARLAFADGRLDARYHCSPGVLANEHLLMLKASGIETRTTAGPDGFGVVGPTSRTKRVYAAPGEESVPYLRPYDVFDFLPQPADQLSKSGSSDLNRLMPEKGTILQTCSGRNLGPLAYADAYLSRFVVSDDMLRLIIDDEADRLYVLAFLSSPTGQALLTRNKTGNVIDHLSSDDLAAVEVPILEATVIEAVVEMMRDVVALRERARLRLSDLIAEVEASLPQPGRPGRLCDGWTRTASGLTSRLDAAFYDPMVRGLRDELAAQGGPRLGDVADSSLPNWYKRHYVDADHGRCIVSGRQLLQTKPIHPQYLTARSLNFDEYELGENTIAFGARGRAEDRLSQPALVTSDRADWLGSENVMRVRAKDGVNPGWLYLSIATTQVQAQIRAATYGAVVDVVDRRGLDDVILPPLDSERGDEALACWRDFASANALEAQAVDLLETEILRGAGAL